MTQNKKIAIVHDYIKEYGGAERVLETLHEIYPEAPVYTLIYAPQFLGPHKKRFASWNIRTSFLQYLPFSYKFISIYRLFAPFIFKTFNFTGFQTIIVSATGAYNPNTINKKSARIICYCHTPPRYLYGFPTARKTSDNPIIKFLLNLTLHFLRMVDYTSSKNVDIYIANSLNVSDRIKKFYRREASIIYPPVNIMSSVTKEHNVSALRKPVYFLTGGRLARPKHIDLIVRACNQRQLPLKIFGKGFANYGEELKEIAGSSIEFLGEISDEEKTEVMTNAKAFIFASEDEDFGILPVEAMSTGIPVIAYYSGGVKESVVEGKTGVFFNELTVNSLNSAITKLEKMKIELKECKKQAEKFSKYNFIKQIKQVVENPK